jgi:uncharacterized protein (DUF1800 family)
MTPTPLLRATLLALLIALLSACGGGGGGGSSPAPSGEAPAANGGSVGDGGGNGGGDNGGGNGGDNGGGNGGDDGAAPLRGIYAAARLGSRATFGADLATIEQIDALGEEGWIEEQFALPTSSHSAVVDELLARLAAGDFDELSARDDDFDPAPVFGRAAWWHTTVTAPDQLRQRVAYALSQVFVISDEVDVLFTSTFGTSDYYDMLLDNAFGNFRTLLRDVTLHPAMGVYLSHLNNARSDPEAGTFPDENYAREVMQLFSIGLFELNPDGSERLDANGEPIPTYDNEDIREFAKVFTGLSFGGFNTRFGSRRANFRVPMQMFDEWHEPGEKYLLNDAVLPAGQSGMADIEAAVDNLFNHPNVGPFIGRQLIQRLVMSNPSPAYVARVTAAFNGEESGVRGDMRALIRAILLDPEARAQPDPQGNGGKLREPLLRYTAMLRQLGVTMPDGFYANIGFLVQQQIQQHPLAAPSVFNFYLPAHQPIGPIAARGLVAPEFQITNSNTVVQLSNLMQFAVFGDFVNDFSEPPFTAAYLDFADFMPLADDADALLDRLDTVFTYGTLRDDTRATIADLLSLIDEPDMRVRVAAYLLLISPDYAVEL